MNEKLTMIPQTSQGGNLFKKKIFTGPGLEVRFRSYRANCPFWLPNNWVRWKPEKIALNLIFGNLLLKGKLHVIKKLEDSAMLIFFSSVSFYCL